MSSETPLFPLSNAGLPDSSSACKLYQMITHSTKRPLIIPNGHKLFLVVINYTNIFHAKAFQNLPKLRILVWKKPSGNPVPTTQLKFFSDVQLANSLLEKPAYMWNLKVGQNIDPWIFLCFHLFLHFQSMSGYCSGRPTTTFHSCHLVTAFRTDEFGLVSKYLRKMTALCSFTVFENQSIYAVSGVSFPACLNITATANW
jgi:hypothetical protein